MVRFVSLPVFIFASFPDVVVVGGVDSVVDSFSGGGGISDLFVYPFFGNYMFRSKGSNQVCRPNSSKIGLIKNSFYFQDLLFAYQSVCNVRASFQASPFTAFGRVWCILSRQILYNSFLWPDNKHQWA